MLSGRCRLADDSCMMQHCDLCSIRCQTGFLWTMVAFLSARWRFNAAQKSTSLLLGGTSYRNVAQGRFENSKVSACAIEVPGESVLT